MHTLRSALFRFEQQIPLCFMHSKWEQYRKMWGRMLLRNDSSRAFAIVLGILEMAIRDNVKTATWKDGMGQSRWEFSGHGTLALHVAVTEKRTFTII